MKLESLSVSTIILLHEEDSFLDDTIYSIKEQSYQPLEIILIDSSIQGHNIELVQDSAGIRYYHQPGCNKAANRNLGINLAQGDVIAFLDTGDRWTHHKLADQVAYLENHPKVEIVQGLIQNVLGTVQYSSQTEHSGSAYGFINPGSLICRRSVFEKVGTFDESLEKGEEIDWFLRAWKKKIVKAKSHQITLLHRQQDSQVFTELISLIQAQFQKTIKKYIDRQKEGIEYSTGDWQDPASLYQYIGNPYEELIINFQPFTIISDDCWGAGPYFDFRTEFHSPFIGIRIEAPCYLELLKDLRGYIESPLVFTNTSKYEGINSWRENNQISFPIARLKDKVELLFMHESDEEICRQKWERRVKRINWDNLFIKFREDGLNFREEYFAEFDRLQYEYKICFTQKDYPEFDWAISALGYFKSLEERTHIYPSTKMYFNVIAWLQKIHGSNVSAYKVQQKAINHLTEDNRSSFFETLHTWFCQIAQAIGTVDRFFSIGGYTVRLSFTSKIMAAQMTQAIAHLDTTPTEHPALTIYLWDNATTQTHLPGLIPDFMRTFQWYEYLDARQNVEPLCSDRFQMHFKLGANIFSALDMQQNQALYWIDDASRIPYEERGSPLQTILSWWTSRQQRQYVYAAAVGTATGGVLLAAPGRSGKSTAALSCLNSPLIYASDDYCLVATDPIPYVYSLYNSAKLKGLKDLEPFPELIPLVSNGDRLHEEKAMIFLNQYFSEKVVSGFPLRAILVPKITGERDTRLSKSTAIAALKALAPSTLFQLSGTGESSFQMMSTLVKQIPCYTLELGTDISQIPQVILEFLARAEHPLPICS
ncbi:DUF1919 domain-containing protein [Merismopedia glauca]|uniref:Glycosyltransferase 2-like domain-containing protein n=1 Tax=Merismopedia glauca CCAP 1448/3 TaxID=1296344 RepID=A0A2T1C001_9CYAN|nr:DUF1919 domain-containing protein [Merismopedia glauca]PSB01599.1 hypothetical protein C7B64_17495 [Merismopedia glauca CCAP 1448/3]